MLYDLWCQVAADRQKELALWELGSGRRWTFGELFSAAASGESRWSLAPDRDESRGMAHLDATGAGFVLQLLAAWRDGLVVCLPSSGAAPDALPTPPAPAVLVKSTSATTGEVRHVCFSAGQLAADARNIVETMGLLPEVPNLGVISMGHSYGFSNLVLPLLLHGIPLILAASPLPEDIRRAERLPLKLALPAVPALWHTWHQAGSIPPNVALAISAGAPLPGPLERAVLDRDGLKIHNFYGSTECGGIAFDATNVPRSEGCVGTALKGVHLDRTEGGCLRVKSAAVGLTYWPKPSVTLGDGVFVTSDLVDLEGGHVFLRGRASDIINVAGRKVRPEDVEGVLQRHPAVIDCVVFGIPAPESYRGDRVVAAVVAEGDVSTQELARFIGGELNEWEVPREWWVVERIDRNPLGKVSRSALRNAYAARRQG